MSAREDLAVEPTASEWAAMQDMKRECPDVCIGCFVAYWEVRLPWVPGGWATRQARLGDAITEARDFLAKAGAT